MLEQERKRFVIDNRMITDRMNNMNDWTEDVDKKLMKLYRYVQPTRCEWRIHKVRRRIRRSRCRNQKRKHDIQRP